MIRILAVIMALVALAGCVHPGPEGGPGATADRSSAPTAPDHPAASPLADGPSSLADDPSAAPIDRIEAAIERALAAASN